MNTRILGFIHTCFLLGTALTNTVNAAGIVVSGYDIGDAVLSGHGGGGHTAIQEL